MPPPIQLARRWQQSFADTQSSVSSPGPNSANIREQTLAQCAVRAVVAFAVRPVLVTDELGPVRPSKYSAHQLSGHTISHGGANDAIHGPRPG
jgi:hypothetical protein